MLSRRVKIVMMQLFSINNSLHYSIKKSKRATRIRITVSASKNIVVTIPYHMPLFLVEKYVTAKSDWIHKKLDYFDKIASKQLISIKEGDYEKYKDNALKVVLRRINLFNQSYGFRYNRISIRNQTSRWGSCSSKRNLSFNFRILFLPRELRDYIIVHELCHLKEMNHSRRFWSLVEQTIPNYKKIRQELKMKSYTLL